MTVCFRDISKPLALKRRPSNYVIGSFIVAFLSNILAFGSLEQVLFPLTGKRVFIMLAG
jgi:hypothetical protein